MRIGLKFLSIQTSFFSYYRQRSWPLILYITTVIFFSEHYCDVKSEFDAKVPRILFKHVSRFVDFF